MEYEAIQLKGGWYVRPKGQLGSCGFHPVAWTITHMRGCGSAESAIRKAEIIGLFQT